MSAPIDDGARVRRIPVTTPKGTFEVWTKRVGDNPSRKVLLLHGGPGMTHEYFEVFADHLPAAGIEFYYYDQLGSFFSDQPEEPELWELDRFVDELEQVRLALGLDASNWYLLGHSWGGLLAMEYAIRHPHCLRGLVVSNMMSSIPAYNRYAEQVLIPEMDPDHVREIKQIEAAGDVTSPRYWELLHGHYLRHVLRMPLDEWPEPVQRSQQHVNAEIYVSMQGPSELGASGKLVDWERSDDLAQIDVPALVIGATFDTMDPAHLRWMASEMPSGRFHLCPRGSHLALYDDEATYFRGLIDFLSED